jgi:hypothetical protein
MLHDHTASRLYAAVYRSMSERWLEYLRVTRHAAPRSPSRLQCSVAPTVKIQALTASNTVFHAHYCTLPYALQAAEGAAASSCRCKPVCTCPERAEGSECYCKDQCHCGGKGRQGATGAAASVTGS